MKLRQPKSSPSRSESQPALEAKSASEISAVEDAETSRCPYLSAGQIHEVLSNSCFELVDTEDAIALYAAWAQCRVTLAELHGAMTSLEEREDRPSMVTPFLLDILNAGKSK